MNQWKWLLISLGLVAAASVGMVGCGDDEKTACTEDSDCDEDAGEICIAKTGKCETACSNADDCEGEDSCSAGCAGSDERDFCFQPCSVDGDCAETDICDLSFCGSKGLCIPAPSCTSDDQCDGDSICVDSVCIEKCTDNDSCGAQEACNVATGHCIALGAACVENEDCGEGNVCDAGVCAPQADDVCTEQLTCYDRGNEYCAGTTSPMTCQDTSCGVAFNSCSRCNSGPNGGDRDAGAPQIFAAFQNSVSSGKNCAVDLKVCQPDAPLVCEFGFFAFDPDDAALPSTGLNNHVGVVSSSGRFSTPFGVKRSTNNGLATFTFRACFAEGGTTAGTAAFLTATANPFANGNAPTTGRSNTLCTIGTK